MGKSNYKRRIIKEDLVSVIIPTYKRNETLERAIVSVEKQTYKNIEIIVVDDNAEYPEIREKNRDTIKKYKNVRMIENNKNLGGGLSRNEGIKNARGSIIAFLDDDDEFLPNKIKRQYDLLKKLNNKKVAMIYCYAKMVNVDGSSYIDKRDIEGCNILENTKNCIAPTSWWLTSKEALLDVGGFEDISSRQDASLLLKLMMKGYSVYRVPEVLVNYYWHDAKNGITTNDDKSIKAEIQYYELFKKLSNGMDSMIKEQVCYYFEYRLANLYVRNGRLSDARKCLKEMRKINKIKKENLRIQIALLVNKPYRALVEYKSKKRYGKS